MLHVGRTRTQGSGQRRIFSRKSQVDPKSVDAQGVGKEYPDRADQVRGYESVAAKARPEATPAPRRSSVLLVDDDNEVVRCYERALAERGYAVAMACDEQAAISLASLQRFDLMVGDIDMRGTHSSDLLLDIRNRRGDLPLVLLSSRVAFESARVAMACRAHRYLLKPVSDRQLVEVVAETMREVAGSPARSGTPRPTGRGPIQSA
jgi:CheY-like chemotaxis protein